jgi:transposase-like protein
MFLKFTLWFVGLMSSTYTKYPPQLKRLAVEAYKAGQHGRKLSAVAKAYGVKGGHRLLQRWIQQYDEEDKAMEKHTHSNRKRKLSEEEVKRHVHDYVAESNEEGKAANY